MNNIKINFRDYETIKKNLSNFEIDVLKDCSKNLNRINNNKYRCISESIEEDEYNKIKLNKKNDEEEVMLIKSCLEVIYINAKNSDVIKLILELKLYTLYLINSLNKYSIEAIEFGIELLSLNDKYFSIIPNKNNDGTIDTNLDNLIICNKKYDKKIIKEIELTINHLNSYLELLEVEDDSRFRYLIHNYSKLYEFNFFIENINLKKLCDYKQFIKNKNKYTDYNTPKNFYSIPGSEYKYINLGRDNI